LSGQAVSSTAEGLGGPPPRFRFHPVLPIAPGMLMFLLIALLSIAMIDTAVGVVARVGRR
jgi:hypothetical protein